MHPGLCIAMFASLTTASFIMPFFGADSLSTRKLDDVAVIGVPKRIKEESLKGNRDRWTDRLVFTFTSTYLWASMGGTAYKQALVISIMDTDADDASYQRHLNVVSISYDKRSTAFDGAVGTGHLTVTKAIYQRNSVVEPSHNFVYIDKSKRLRLDWHAVEKEVSLAEGMKQIAAMAASFKIVRDPKAAFAEMRDRPRKEAEDRTRKRALAVATLAREGFSELVPGKPVQKGGMYVEWMADPEPRYQLLVPLGRIRAAARTGGPAPRPLAVRTADGKVRDFPGSIGWYAHTDEGWEFSNADQDYYPFVGVSAVLKARHQDTGEILYFYAATVRVEESDDALLSSIAWFTSNVPEVQKLWREGKLVPGTILDR